MAPPPQFGDDTGAIQGSVINEENLPVPGALIGIVELKAETVSDAQGQFTLSNIPPGTHNVLASALGYAPAARRVDVVQGAVAQVQFSLAPVEVAAAYHKLQPKAGNIQCTVRAYPGVPTTGAGGLPPWVTGVAACGVANLSVVVPLPPDKFLLTWDIPNHANEMLLEMEWKSTQATGRGLDVVVEHLGASNVAAKTFARDLGTSPLRAYANNTTMMKVAESSGVDCWETKCKLQTRAFGAANTTEYYLPIDPPPLGPLGKPSNKVDAGFVIDQRFRQYLTTFHDMVRPDGYTAVQDQ